MINILIGIIGKLQRSVVSTLVVGFKVLSLLGKLFIGFMLQYIPTYSLGACTDKLDSMVPSVFFMWAMSSFSWYVFQY